VGSANKRNRQNPKIWVALARQNPRRKKGRAKSTDGIRSDGFPLISFSRRASDEQREDANDLFFVFFAARRSSGGRINPLAQWPVANRHARKKLDENTEGKSARIFYFFRKPLDFQFFGIRRPRNLRRIQKALIKQQAAI